MVPVALAVAAFSLWPTGRAPDAPAKVVRFDPSETEPTEPLIVWREVEQGVYQPGMLSPDLTFEPSPEQDLIRIPEDEIRISGPLIWSLHDRKAGKPPQFYGGLRIGR